MTTQPTLVCQQFSVDAQGVVNCAQQAWVESYIFSPAEQAQVELILQGGMNWETFGMFFVGTLLMFGIGFGTGLIISQVRKI